MIHRKKTVAKTLCRQFAVTTTHNWILIILGVDDIKEAIKFVLWKRGILWKNVFKIIKTWDIRNIVFCSRSTIWISIVLSSYNLKTSRFIIYSAGGNEATFPTLGMQTFICSVRRRYYDKTVLARINNDVTRNHLLRNWTSLFHT